MKRRSFITGLLGLPVLAVAARKFMEEAEPPTPRKPQWRHGMSTHTGEVFLIGSSTNSQGRFYWPYVTTKT